MVTNGNLSQNGNVTRYSTAQLAMDGVYSWIINSPDSTMVSKLINCAYSYDTISGELNGGIFLLIGFRSGGYAHITAHSYWNNRAISVAIIENGVWTKRFDKILTNTDLAVKRYDVPRPSTNNIFTSFSNYWVRIFKSGKVVTITLNLSGSMTASNTTHSLFTIPAEYRPSADVIVNYITQQGTPMVLDISGDLTQIKLGNRGTAIADDWLCRQCITYVTDN